jgi:hypothetical protein
LIRAHRPVFFPGSLADVAAFAGDDAGAGADPDAVAA